MAVRIVPASTPKPSSFTPILALIGIIFYMFCKNAKKKDTGMILLGFATLMFGMETMSGAVSGLRDVPAFQQMFIMFKNPLLGVPIMTLMACFKVMIPELTKPTTMTVVAEEL